MRTLLGKHLILYLGTLIISFIFLGAALSQAIRAYFTNQRVNYLTDSGRRIAGLLDDFGGYGVFDEFWLNAQINAMYQYLDLRMIIIINRDFEALGGAAYLTEPEKPVYVKEMDPLRNGEPVVLEGSARHLFKESMLVVGYPHPSGTFSILIGSSIAELGNTISGMYRITFLCLAVTALFAFGLVYISSKSISRPLRQMNDAARVIADGAFDKRIPVTSRDEVGQLADRFNHMAGSLQAQEEIRRSFIANLSHDLRSPLTSIRGFLQAIRDGAAPPEKTPYYLDIVMDETERLIKLSNDLLDIRTAADSEIRINPAVYDINGMIRDTVMRFERRALDKGLTIRCRFAHEEDLVWADGDKIQRVLYNLLDNAVKFTPAQHGEIIVETTARNKKIAVAIQDNGRGVTEAEMKLIFDRFYKGDPSRGEDKDGSGLGLSIVKEFIQAHGENVTAVSPPEGGCVITFTLPAAPL